MGAIAIQIGSQTTAGGGVQRLTTVTLPRGLQPTRSYWLGVKISTANNGISRLSLGTTDILTCGRNATVEAALNAAYPIPVPLPGPSPAPPDEWWGFDVLATLLPPLYPNFSVAFSLQTKRTAVQTVFWHIVQAPGPFNSPLVPEARGTSTI